MTHKMTSSSLPAVVKQYTEEYEHQEGQWSKNAEQEQGVVGGDVPQSRVRQTETCETLQEMWLKIVVVTLHSSLYMCDYKTNNNSIF